MKRKIAAILAADIEGYSRLVSDDEEDALRRLASYRDVFADFVAQSGGRIFNTAGDAVLAEFGSSVEAMRCAIDVQESLRTRNLGYLPTRQMLFRIGLTVGDVVERDGDLLGDGVNIAARLQTLAAPGGICVSRSVYEQVAGKISVPFRDIGEQDVKNIAHRVHVYMADTAKGAQPSPRPGGSKPGPRRRSDRAPSSGVPLALAGAAAVLGIAALAVALIGGSTADRSPSTNARSAATVAVPTSATPAEAFTMLAGISGLIPDPRTVAQWYHNARAHEARGDPDAARRDYAALVAHGTDALDPLVRYAALLRGNGGYAMARETFAPLAKKGALGARLVYALQFEQPERRKRLEDLLAANPDYGPAYLHLAREFSTERVGEQTLDDRRHEFAALDRFLEFNAQGKLDGDFMDLSMLNGWLERARRSHALLDAFLKTAPSVPVATFVRTPRGWSVSLLLPEAALRVGYRIKPGDAFTATLDSAQIDSRTGRPVPKTTFDLPGAMHAGVIEVDYSDMHGVAQGPFAFKFDAFKALVKEQQERLDRFPTAWVSYAANGEQALIFRQLAAFRCTIRKVEFGFDDAPPMRALPLPACDPADPQAPVADRLVTVPLPTQAKAVSLQLTYVDGSRSEIRTFPRP